MGSFCMSCGPSNPSSFTAYFTISSSLSVHRSKNVEETGYPFLTPPCCSRNTSTNHRPFSINIPICIIFFQSSLLGTVSKARERERQRERLVFLAAGGNEVQAALQRFTGQYTVPNVFIGNSIYLSFYLHQCT